MTTKVKFRPGVPTEYLKHVVAAAEHLLAAQEELDKHFDSIWLGDIHVFYEDAISGMLSIEDGYVIYSEVAVE